MQINKERVKKNLDESVAVLTYLSQFIGYDRASEVYEEHKKTKDSIPDIILNKKLLSKEELEELLSIEKIQQLGIKK